jgi:hypothetical protein
MKLGVSVKNMFLRSSKVKKSCQCQLRDKKTHYFSIASLPTDSVIVDHAVAVLGDFFKL